MPSVEAIVEKLVSALGPPRSDASGGGELAWCCPMCVRRGHKRDDVKYRLSVNPSKQWTRARPGKPAKFSPSGWCWCFNCGYGGPVSRLLESLGVILDITPSEWQKVAERIKSLGLAPVSDEDAALIELPEIGFPCNVHPVLEGSPAWKYLLDTRGLTPQQIEVYRPLVGSGSWSNRIFFPDYNDDGQLIFYSARSFGPNARDPKYLSPGGGHRIYAIYRYNAVMRRLLSGKSDRVIVTEGVISAVRAGWSGVATYGKAFSPEHTQRLRHMAHQAEKPVTFYAALDGDAGSYNVRLARALFDLGLTVKVVDMPGKHDPASLPVEQWEECLHNAWEYRGLSSELRYRVQKLSFA